MAETVDLMLFLQTTVLENAGFTGTGREVVVEIPCLDPVPFSGC